jgi:PIN domain nuclease of toxin-antitoxin system
VNRYLLDTHLLLWALAIPHRLHPTVTTMLRDEGAEVLFSPASIWEVAIKAALGRPDFTVDADTLARAAIVSGFRELPIVSAATARVQRLPPIHNDPFDRILVAQAIEASVILLTADLLLPPYSPLVRRVPRG